MRSRWLHFAAVVLGLGLVGAAVVVAARGVDWQQLRGANPLLLLGLAGLVVTNLVLTAGLLWLVTLGFDALPVVRAREMLALLTASSLLNYLPLSPGLVSRTAYLKLRHGLPVRQQVIILVVVRVVGAMVMTSTLWLVLLHTAWGRWLALAVSLGLLSVVTEWVAPKFLRRPAVLGWAWVPLRTLDMLAAAGRLALAFAVLGQPLPFSSALLAGAASMFVSQLGITPNGLGLSEWTVGGITAALEVSTGPVGVAAKLIDRGVEAVVVVVAGLWGVRQVRR